MHLLHHYGNELDSTTISSVRFFSLCKYIRIYGPGAVNYRIEELEEAAKPIVERKDVVKMSLADWHSQQERAKK